MEIEISNIDYICKSKYDLGFDACTICYESFDDKCDSCQDSLQNTTVNCPITEGNCRHCFHLHCWERYIKNQEENEQLKCPYCRNEYEYEIIEDKKEDEFLNEILNIYNKNN